MRMNALRILTVCMAIVMLIAIGVSAVDTVLTLDSKDGIVAELTTDKDAYESKETIGVNLHVTNNTGKRVSVTAQLQTPDGFTAANGASEAVIIEAGQTEKMLEASMTPGEPKAQKNTGIWIWVVIILAILVIAGAVILFLYGKDKRTYVSMLLCLIMVASLLLSAAPKAEASRNNTLFSSSFVTSKTVAVGGEEVKVAVLVSYDVGVADPVDVPVDPTPDTQPDSNGGDDTGVPDDRLTAFYFNDFEDEMRYYGAGATISMNNNWFEKKTKDENTYLEMSITDSSAGGYIQADFKNNVIVDNLVFTVSLSTEGQVPVGSYIQYRYNSTTNATFVWINKDNSLRIGNTTYSDLKIEAGKWLKLTFVFDLVSDPNADYADVYVGDQHLTKITLPKHEEFYKIPYMRISLVGKSGDIDNKGATLLVDDLAIYQGKEILGLDQIKSAPYETWTPPTVIKDTAMEYPELSEFGNRVVAVLADTNRAYINGEAVTVSEQFESTYVGARFTDAMVSETFLKEHLGISGLPEGKHSLLRYAAGWSIFVDSRGLVILTKDVVLNEDDNIDAVTMLYGYLKTGELVSNYAVAPVFTQSIIDQAVATQLVPFPAYAGRNDYAGETAHATYYLVLAAHMDENTAASDGTLCRDAAIERIRFWLAGGNEPYASPGCWWAHGVVSSTIVLAKNTPAIWDALTEEEIARADLLMECLAVAANWGYNEQNDYKTGFDLLGNFGKNYNPNYLNSYLTCYFSASMYFGAEQLDDIFLAFDYDKYIERLEKANFKNILSVWTNQDIVGVSIGEYMTNGGEIMLVGSVAGDNTQKPEAKPAGSGVGVKVAWAFKDMNGDAVYRAGDYVPLFIDVVEYTYKWCCQAENRAKGAQYWSHTISGERSPWEGQMGMMTEFSTSDGGGVHARSRTMYCWTSFQNIIPLYANLKLLGYWDHSEETPETANRMLEMDRRIMVGSEDLLFKINEGYIGWSSQKEYKELEENYNEGQGLQYPADIWRNFHALGNEDVEIDSKELENVLAPHAEPKDGITVPSEGAILNENRGDNSQIPYDAYVPLDGNCYTSGEMEFDVVVGDEVNETTFDSIIIIDRAMRGKQLVDSPMLIAFNDGYISIYSTSGYKQTGLNFGENYRYHFQLAFDVKEMTYTVEITQTWPQTEEAVQFKAIDLGFRLSAPDTLYVDSVTVTGPGQDVLWVENLKMLEGTTRVRSPYKETYEFTVKNLWDGVPAEARPDSFTVRLIMNGGATGRTVTFTKEDGWADKVFDNLPKELNKFEIEWGIQVEKIENYYSVCTDIKDDTITISWIEDSLFVDEDFEDGVLDTLIDESERYPSMKPGVIIQDDDNHYLCLENDGAANQLCIQPNGLTSDRQLTGKFDNVLIQMDLKLDNADQVVSGHMNYRKLESEDKVVACSFILINNNVIKFTDGKKTVELGVLTDQWQTLKIWYDVKNNTMMVSFGEDTNFALMSGMPAIVADQIRLATGADSGALCVDNVFAHCDKEWTMDQNLQTMKTTVDVKLNWDGITPADSVIVKLLADGVDTGKTLTLSAADGWAGRFTGLQKYVDGTTEIVYTIEVPAVGGYKGVPAKMIGSLITVTYSKQITFYDDDFNDKDYGTIKSYGDATLGLLGDAGQHWIHVGGENDGTFEISDSLISAVPSLTLEMKIKIDSSHTDMVMFRYNSTGAEKDKTPIFYVYGNGDVRSGTAVSSTFMKLTVDQWTYLKVIMDFEANTMQFFDENGVLLRTVKNVSDNNGSFVRIWAASTASLHIDDLKIYCNTAESGVTPPVDTEAKTDLSVKAEWVDITPAGAVTVTLMADGAATDKILILSEINQWMGTFAGLKKYSEGTTEVVYTIEAVAADGTKTLVSEAKDGLVNVLLAKELLIYSDDFDDKDAGSMSFSGNLSFDEAGTNAWLKVGAGNGGTYTVQNDWLSAVPNLILEMKLKIDSSHTDLVHFRYNSTGPDDAKTQIFAIYANGDLRTGTVASSTFKTLTVDQWMYLRVVMDFEEQTIKFYDENGTLLATKSSSYPNDGNFVRFWSANAASLCIDDLKIYSQPQGLVAPEVKTERNVNIVWSGVSAPEAVELELLADGQQTGKKLVLNATVGWNGSFAGLAMYNAQQVAIVYSVKAPEVSGIKAVVSDDGAKNLTVTYSDKTYYYQDDFNDQDWGIFKTFGTVSFAGSEDNYWLYYANGTSTLSLDQSVISADNLVIEMKLMVGDDYGGAVEFRYDSDGSLNANTPFLAVNSDKSLGKVYSANASARGTFLTLEPNQWTYIKVVFDWETKTCTYYDADGLALATRTNIDQLDGCTLKIWSNGGAALNIDDLTVYALN